MKKEKRNLRIICDTREQTPLTFALKDNVEMISDKLDCGDYTLCGHDMPNDDYSIIIERKKDCSELITCLGRQWDRFERECELLSQYKNKIIVVESLENFGWLYKVKRTKMHPNYCKSKLMEIFLRWQIPTFFFEDRESMENFLFRIFHKTLELEEEDNERYLNS